MLKKLAALLTALLALCSSALAIEPSALTQSMYEKASNIQSLDISDSGSMTAVYIVLGVLVVFVLLFWFMDRKNRRLLRQAQQQLQDKGKQLK